MPPDQQTAFISYSRADEKFVLRLAHALKAADAQVWLDQLEILPGQHWQRAVQEAMASSTRMLVVLSPTSVLSPNVEDEISFALHKHKDLIPVMYLDCEVPFRLLKFQYADFRGDFAAGLASLLRAMGVTLSDAGNGTKAQFSSSQQPPDVPIEKRPDESQAAREAVVASAAQKIEPTNSQTTISVQVYRSPAYRFGVLMTRPLFLCGVLILLWLAFVIFHIAGAIAHLLLVIALVLPMLGKRRWIAAIVLGIISMVVLYLLGAFLGTF